ncbi:MAG: M48 family metallopeptidase [Pseudobdellovibrionaceae bacterium]
MSFFDLLLKPFSEKKPKSKNRQTQHEVLVFQGLRILVVRRARQKNMRIAVKPNQDPRLSTNLSTSRKQIETFVESNWEWLQKTLQKMQKWSDERPQLQMKENESFPLLGESRNLKIRITPLKKAFLSSDERHLHLNLPENEWKNRDSHSHWQHYKGALQKYYQREAEKVIGERVKIWIEKTGLRPTQVRFRAQKSRWGSCSSQGHLSLNWKLIIAPISVIDYVIVHELCHLKYLNHSHAFWSLVEKWYPKYEEAEDWLKRKGFLSEFLNT